ncbi:MAG: hypothetical protein R3F37_10470 [Candidatus Competibacteraceae bacterium]
MAKEILNTLIIRHSNPDAEWQQWTEYHLMPAGKVVIKECQAERDWLTNGATVRQQVNQTDLTELPGDIRQQLEVGH